MRNHKRKEENYIDPICICKESNESRKMIPMQQTRQKMQLCYCKIVEET